MVDIYTPEHLGWGKGQAEMVRRDDSTEDDMLYVTYDDYTRDVKDIAKINVDLLKRSRELEGVVRAYIHMFPAFRSKPVGAPGSDARRQQEGHSELEDIACAILTAQQRVS